MSIEQHQQELVASYNGSDDLNVKAAAVTANNYTELLKSGQLNKDEYIELMKDIERTNNINRSVHNQQVMEYMNVAINGLVNIASLTV